MEGGGATRPLLMPVSQQDVFDLLRDEREYQRLRWGNEFIQPNSPTVIREVRKPVESFLVYMKSYVDKAIDQISGDNDDVKTLEFVRKLTALGVACMEQHGAPPRIPLNVESIDVINGRSGHVLQLESPYFT